MDKDNEAVATGAIVNPESVANIQSSRLEKAKSIVKGLGIEAELNAMVAKAHRNALNCGACSDSQTFDFNGSEADRKKFDDVCGAFEAPNQIEVAIRVFLRSIEPHFDSSASVHYGDSLARRIYVAGSVDEKWLE